MTRAVGELDQDGNLATIFHRSGAWSWDHTPDNPIRRDRGKVEPCPECRSGRSLRVSNGLQSRRSEAQVSDAPVLRDLFSVSDTDRANRKRAAYRAQARSGKLCEWCDRELPSARITKRFCSPAHKEAARREREKAS